MKINININNKWQRISIKGYDYMTLGEYRQVLEYINEHKEIPNIVKYISIVTGIEYNSAMNSTIKGAENLNHLGFVYLVKGLNEKVKGLNYIEDLDVKKIFEFKGKYYDFKNINVRARGYRVLLSQYMNTKPSYIDLYTFCLAMILDSDFDFDNIERIKKELDSYNYIKVLSLGSFFFFNITNGNSFVVKCLQMLTKRLLIWSLKPENKRALKT